MSKDFRFLDLVAAKANNQVFNEEQQDFIAQGREEFRGAGMSTSGDIVVPLNYRAVTDPGAIVAGVGSGYGAENIQTTKLSFEEGLRNAMVLPQLGATMMHVSGGNISLPIYSGSTSTWKGEIAAAADGRGVFSDVEIKPMRLCTKIPVSKLFLQQCGADAERILIQDICNSISEKLEQTIFGTGAGDTDTPKGMFNAVTAMTTDINYKDLCTMEETLMSAKQSGNYKFVCAPSAKTSLRTTEKSERTGQYLLDGNESIGYPVVSSGAVANKGLILGDWSKLIVCQWGGIDIICDNLTLAGSGQIVLVCNSYWGVAVKDESAFVKKVLK